MESRNYFRKALRNVSWSLALGLLFCVSACRQTADDPIDKSWKRIPVEPVAFAPILQAAENLPCAWKVSNGQHGLIIAAVPLGDVASRPLLSPVTTEAGGLVGSSAGEYIGSLRLIGARDRTETVLLHDNILALVPFRSGVLVLSGLAHLGVDRGSAWFFAKGSDGKWSLNKLADLDGYPWAISAANNEVLAVTGNGVTRIGADLKLVQIAQLPLQIPHPSSVAEDSSHRVYVGTQAIVVRLTPSSFGYTREWFTRPPCSVE